MNEIADSLNDGSNELKVITCVPNYPAGKIFEGYGFFKKSREKKGKMTIRRLPMLPRGSGSKLRIVLNYFTYFLSTLLYTLHIAFFNKRYDIVFVHHTSPIFISISPILYKLFRRKAKLVLWDLDIWPDTLKAVNAVKSESALVLIEKMVKAIYGRYDHILVGSKSFVDIVCQRVKGVPVSYFPNWAEDVFTQGVVTQPEKEPEFPQGLKIMFAGNIGAAQDMATVFEAAKLVKDQPVQWLFVGDGRRRNWLEEQVNSNGMHEQFTFYGNNPISLMPYFFSKADVMLVSLKDEEIFRKTVPAKVQAYMAFEKPILGLLSGEGSELIKEADCGWAAASGDATALAEAVRQIVKLSETERLEKAKKGKIYFDQNFRKDLRVQQLNLLFQQLSSN